MPQEKKYYKQIKTDFHPLENRKISVGYVLQQECDLPIRPDGGEQTFHAKARLCGEPMWVHVKPPAP
jgi:hypothetical protein